MKKILVKHFESYYKYNAIFFSETNIIVYPNENTPFINFKDGLNRLESEIKEVFLDENLLFIESDKPSKQSKLDIYPSKAFLGNTSNNNITHILRGLQYLIWNRKCCYCSQCGGSINAVDYSLEKKCVACDLSYFPNLSPAVIVLIKRENEILLARSPHFKSGMYSAIAGFIDVGETAESAVHREVQEEVGLKIKSLQYFGSQSWPSSGSFMIAFTAEYLSGEIIVEPNEIEDAKWFHIDNLPGLPAMSSISRQLIDSVLQDLN